MNADVSELPSDNGEEDSPDLVPATLIDCDVRMSF
jgi:hypothetical protein